MPFAIISSPDRAMAEHGQRQPDPMASAATYEQETGSQDWT